MIFPHLSGHAIDYPVNGRIHVVRFCTGFDGDMLVTTQDDVRPMAIFFEIQDSVHFEDRWIIEMQRC
jgi:hypothetical protein